MAARGPRAEPRWETPRTPSRLTFGKQTRRFAEHLGRRLMPWQERLALGGGELVEVAVSDLPLAMQERLSGTEHLLVPAFRTVGFGVPRQSGKTTVKQAWACQRAHGLPWRGPQRILYSAQTGRAASEKITEDWFPDMEPVQHQLGIRRLYRGVGKEGILWHNGSRLSIVADDQSSGHGKVLHLGLQDELFADRDERRDGAMRPAQNTIADAQLLKTSTAGTLASVTWNAFVDRGRAAAERGDTSGLYYVEYSAPPGSDPEDEDVWWECMPALGYTIGLEVVRDALREMRGNIAEFCRAYLNIPIGAQEDYAFSTGVWERGRVTAGLRPEDLARLPDVGGALSVDVTADRDHAFIGAAVPHLDGTLADIVQEGPGTHWVVDALEGLWNATRVPVRFDTGGPAGAIAAEAAARGVAMVPVPNREVLAACGGLFDAVAATPPMFWHPYRPRLDDAATHLVKEKSGSLWRWQRRAEYDPAPVYALTLARFAVTATPARQPLTPEDTGVS